MTCPIHGEESVPNCNFCIGRTTGEITLDRLRIVRNAIVREWQLSEQAQKGLPENAASKKRLSSYMAGLRQALVMLYQEFDELEPIPMDQKPRCLFCGEEMDHPDLAAHMTEHLKAGDKISPDVRGISPAAPGLPLDNVPMFRDTGLCGPSNRNPKVNIFQGTPLTSEMAIAASLVEEPPIEVILHGIKYKKPSREALEFVIRECFQKRDDGPAGITKRNEAMCAEVGDYLTRILEAGGQGGAAHPDQNPDAPDADPSPEKP